ncbi:hypothetical protein OBBRIDRAFT_712453, partial [Obba rivulosa]
YIDDKHNFTNEDQETVLIDKNYLYRHTGVQVSYMTYNLYRANEIAQDTINPHIHADIIVLAWEDEKEGHKAHLYWYAQVTRVYHTIVRH